MSKFITVSAPTDTTLPIQLAYSIAVVANIQTISCSISEPHHPQWLQMRKFDLLSMKEKNGYVPLFNELNSSKNMATSLFIDQVYSDIMLAEKFRVLSPV
jgi:hypothetical protein